jgi:hypothetical protein
MTLEREELAQRVIDKTDFLATKLVELREDIRALWVEFEKLPKGQTIAGCRTKTEFCRRHLPEEFFQRADDLLKEILKGKGFDLSGQTFDDGNLFVHEKFEQSPRDRSWVWLVENKKTGKAELWRSCDLTRIQRRGQRHNKKSYACFRAFPGNPEWQEWMQRAEERLQEIKAGEPQ